MPTSLFHATAAALLFHTYACSSLLISTAAATAPRKLDSFKNVQRINATLTACKRNHVGYSGQASSSSTDHEACYAYFKRDLRQVPWCDDKDGEFEFLKSGGSKTDARFVAMGGSAKPIPCARAVFKQGTDMQPDALQECTPDSSQPSGWKINSDVNNFLFPDFEAPQYQSSSCCSSTARFDFSFDTPYQGKANHNPFINAHIEVGCQVQRRSSSGNRCGSFSDGWRAFGGTGACGVNVGSSDKATMNLAVAKLKYLKNSGANLTRHQYCPRTPKEQCGTYRSFWDGVEGDLTCDAPISTMQKFDYQRVCTGQMDTAVSEDTSFFDIAIPTSSNEAIALPPMSVSEIAGCQRCRGLFKALNAFPCSPRQGYFVSRGEFRVCKSACDKLFETCGKPTHRGGMFVRSKWDSALNFFERGADYDNAREMCHALWNPHPDSVWAMNNITIKVVDDENQAVEGECVAFERSTYMLNFDTQNFIFDYGAINNGEGYCSLKDPLYNADAPCADLEKAYAAVNGRRLSSSTHTDGGNAMYARDDAERAKLISEGWPWEGNALGVGLGSGGAFFVLCALAVIYLLNDGDGSGSDGAMPDPRGEQL